MANHRAPVLLLPQQEKILEQLVYQIQMVGQRTVLSANLVTGVSAGSLCGQWKRDRPLPQSQGHLSCNLRLGTVPGPHSNAREHVSDMQKTIWKSWRSMTSHCRIFEEVMADLAPAITESVHYRSLAAD